jgi:hypothetical protein
VCALDNVDNVDTQGRGWRRDVVDDVRSVRERRRGVEGRYRIHRDE